METTKVNVVFDKRGGEEYYAVWQILDKNKGIDSYNSALISYLDDQDEWTDSEISELTDEEISTRINSRWWYVGKIIGDIREDIFDEVPDLCKWVECEAEIIEGIINDPLIKVGNFIARLRKH